MKDQNNIILQAMDKVRDKLMEYKRTKKSKIVTIVDGRIVKIDPENA